MLFRYHFIDETKHPNDPWDELFLNTARELGLDPDFIGRMANNLPTTARSNENREFPLVISPTVGRIVRELEVRITTGTSSQSESSIAGRLELAYYQKLLAFHEGLPFNTDLDSSRMILHCLDHKKQIQELRCILDYFAPNVRASLERALPNSIRLRPRKGRPASRRQTALQALQMKVDTGRSWPSILKEVCDCPKKDHDESCFESLRQSLISGACWAAFKSISLLRTHRAHRSSPLKAPADL
jgi:hypothetical protein